jgi:hypothetical protein
MAVGGDGGERLVGFVADSAARNLVTRHDDGMLAPVRAGDGRNGSSMLAPRAPSDGGSAAR